MIWARFWEGLGLQKLGKNTENHEKLDLGTHLGRICFWNALLEGFWQGLGKVLGGFGVGFGRVLIGFGGVLGGFFGRVLGGIGTM